MATASSTILMAGVVGAAAVVEGEGRGCRKKVESAAMLSAARRLQFA